MFVQKFARYHTLVCKFSMCVSSCLVWNLRLSVFDASSDETSIGSGVAWEQGYIYITKSAWWTRELNRGIVFNALVVTNWSGQSSRGEDCRHGMDLDPFRPEELCFTLLPKPDSQRGHRHNYYDGENGGLLIGPRSLKEMAFVQLSQRTWYLVMMRVFLVLLKT